MKRIATRMSGIAPKKALPEFGTKCAAMFRHSMAFRRVSSGSCRVEVAGDGDFAAAMLVRNCPHSVSNAAIDRRCVPTQLPTKMSATAGGMKEVGFNS
ncbi:MAG: hypothetical protein V4819_25900 [Verrucomicrobiota bacterium]